MRAANERLTYRERIAAEREAEIDRFHVVTGAPGSGKTAMLAALAAHGVRTSVEAGRAIIQTEVAAGSNALPWADAEAFARATLGLPVPHGLLVNLPFAPIEARAAFLRGAIASARRG